MRKLFLTMTLGLALGAAGLPVARDAAAAAQPPLPEAPLVQVHYDGHGWGRHHRPPPPPPWHWRRSHGFEGGGHRHWREPPHHRRYGYDWRADQPRYGWHDRFHHHGR